MTARASATIRKMKTILECKNTGDLYFLQISVKEKIPHRRAAPTLVNHVIALNNFDQRLDTKLEAKITAVECSPCNKDVWGRGY